MPRKVEGISARKGVAVKIVDERAIESLNVLGEA
jgi:hypothetical protein